MSYCYLKVYVETMFEVLKIFKLENIGKGKREKQKVEVAK
jgi:hypothetical protein